jgi:hypothetical protein
MRARVSRKSCVLSISEAATFCEQGEWTEALSDAESALRHDSSAAVKHTHRTPRPHVLMCRVNFNLIR